MQVWSAHGTFFRDVTVVVTLEKKSFAHPLCLLRTGEPGLCGLTFIPLSLPLGQ